MGKRTEKWYNDKLIKYFYKHYGEHDGATEWFVNPATNRWKCYIPKLELTIIFTCDDEGNIFEEKLYKNRALA